MPKLDGGADSIGSARFACSFIQDQLSFRGVRREIQPLISPKLLRRLRGLSGEEETANTVKARTAYKDFLTLWKDADPDVPAPKQAQAEYAKLQ